MTGRWSVVVVRLPKLMDSNRCEPMTYVIFENGGQGSWACFSCWLLPQPIDATHLPNI